MPRTFGTILRILVGIVLSVGLIHLTLKTTGGAFWSELLMAKKIYLILPLLLSGGVLAIQTYRWNLLLKVQGIHMKGWDLLRLTLIGIFFNLALPGAVSGDVVKIGFAVRQVKDKKVEAALSVFMDRVLGLFGLLPLASLMVMLNLPFLLELEPKYRPIQIAAFAVGLCSIGGILAIAMVELRHIFMRWQRIVWIVHLGKIKLPALIVSRLERLVHALEIYHDNRRTIASAIGLSILVHSCLALNLFFVGISYGENVLCLSDYFLTTQVSNAIAAIPVTPAGIGTRDAVTAMFLAALQVPQAIIGVVPVTVTLIILFWGLVGGMVLVFSRGAKSATEILVF